MLRNAGKSAERVMSGEGTFDMSCVTGDTAYELIKLIYRFPEVVREAADKYEPSVVTRHIIDIAQYFNRFYHDEHILVEDEAEKQGEAGRRLRGKTDDRQRSGTAGHRGSEKM